MGYRNFKNKSVRGIYVILDLMTFSSIDLRKLDGLLSDKIVAVQIWDNMPDYTSHLGLMESIIAIVQKHQIPILMNNRNDLLENLNFDGVHFDEIPYHWEPIKPTLSNKLVGITCTNNMDIIRWAESNKIDYISFCSMFPSVNNSRCVLVDRRLLNQIRNITAIPFFLAGGIKPENISELNNFPYKGVALVSGLMQTQNPRQIIDKYFTKMNFIP